MSTARMLFMGSAWKARGKGKEIRITAGAFGGALERQIPRFQFSPTCNHTLFSYGCTRRRPVDMAQAAWQSTADYVEQWTDPKVILEGMTFATGIGGSPADHLFVGGWLETGTGTTRQVREIIGSWTVSGPQLHLAIARPLRTDLISVGQEVRFWPGCDGQYSTCGTRFSNTSAFGGFPFMPAWIEQAPMGMPKTGK